MRILPALGLAALLAGCYRPHIAEGALRCGPSGLCPEGFTCSMAMVCVGPGGGADMGMPAGVFSGRLGPLDLTGIVGTVEVSTMSGEIKLRGSVMSFVAAGADGFSRVPQANGPTLAVWSFGRVFIPSTVQVKPAPDSTDALPVFATTAELDVEGAIDWRGYGGLRGAAGMPGADKNSGVASFGGAGTGDGGGGGGGHADVGKLGLGTGGGVAGLAYGTPDLRPVHMGAGGGGGGNVGGAGGAGGGSVVLLSQSTITIKALIDASGNPGVDGGDGGGGGGGGGSGGSILISGMRVNLEMGHDLRARGGTGGIGSGTGFSGGDGAAGRIWIGGILNVAGSSLVEPMPTVSEMPLASFPAP